MVKFRNDRIVVYGRVLNTTEWSRDIGEGKIVFNHQIFFGNKRVESISKWLNVHLGHLVVWKPIDKSRNKLFVAYWDIDFLPKLGQNSITLLKGMGWEIKSNSGLTFDGPFVDFVEHV